VILEITGSLTTEVLVLGRPPTGKLPRQSVPVQDLAIRDIPVYIVAERSHARNHD
jgi:hypothetical protein